MGLRVYVLARRLVASWVHTCTSTFGRRAQSQRLRVLLPECLLFDLLAALAGSAHRNGAAASIGTGCGCATREALRAAAALALDGGGSGQCVNTCGRAWHWVGMALAVWHWSGMALVGHGTGGMLGCV